MVQSARACKRTNRGVHRCIVMQVLHSRCFDAICQPIEWAQGKTYTVIVFARRL